MNAMIGSFNTNRHTETADTVIVDLIQPKISAIAKINALRYLSAGTAHTCKIMKALGSTTTTAAAAAAATSLAVAALSFDPGQTLAANDYIAIQLASGEYFLTLVSAVSTLTLTISALPEAVNSGAKVWIFGAPADTGHMTLVPTTSATTDYDAPAPSCIADSGYSFVSSGTRYKKDGVGRPLMFYSPNGTAAGVLQYMSGSYWKY